VKAAQIWNVVLSFGGQPKEPKNHHCGWRRLWRPCGRNNQMPSNHCKL